MGDQPPSRLTVQPRPQLLSRLPVQHHQLPSTGTLTSTPSPITASSVTTTRTGWTPLTTAPPRASAASSTTATRTLSPPTLLLPSSSLTLTRISIPDLGTQRECGSMEARQSTSPTGTSPLTRRTQGQNRSVPEV